MAEVNTGGGGDKGGKKRSKKQSTKIDMTPMVDLGFLLITFFILTTTLQKPQTMQLNMPDKNEEKKETTPVKLSESLAVVLGKNNKVYYFQGLSSDPNTKVEVTDFSPKGIRQVLLEKKAEIGEKFTVVLQVQDEATYKNTVDMLDELAITGCERYAIIDNIPQDNEMIKKQYPDNK